MEHLHHFELRQDPFQIEPDLRIYFDSPSHSDAQQRVERGLRQMKGLTVLTGEGGTGKTLVARRILNELEEEVFEANLMVMLPGAAEPGPVLQRFAKQLGVDQPADDRAALMVQIYEMLAAVREEGRHSVLILDDAHLLGAGPMAEVGGLLNLEYEDRRLLSLLLVGLPILDDPLLQNAAMESRVDVRVRLQPLDLANASAYLQHRLRAAGGRPEILSDEAIIRLFELGGGRPRLMNTLADNALFEAFLGKRNQIAGSDVDRAAADLGVEGAPMLAVEASVTASMAAPVVGNAVPTISPRAAAPAPAAAPSPEALEPELSLEVPAEPSADPEPDFAIEVQGDLSSDFELDLSPEFESTPSSEVHADLGPELDSDFALDFAPDFEGDLAAPPQPGFEAEFELDGQDGFKTALMADSVEDFGELLDAPASLEADDDFSTLFVATETEDGVSSTIDLDSEVEAVLNEAKGAGQPLALGQAFAAPLSAQASLVIPDEGPPKDQTLDELDDLFAELIDD